jgi:hypothetical protein
MTPKIDIQVKAQQLVRDSRGRLNHMEALRELSRRSAVSRASKRAKLGSFKITGGAEGVESPRIRLPYADN